MLWSDEFDGMVPLLALSIPADVLLILSRVLQLALMAAGRIRVYLIHTIGTQIVHLALFRWGLSVGELEGALYGHLTYALVTLVTAMAILSPRGGKGSRSFNVALPLTIGLLSSLLVGLLPPTGWSGPLVAILLAGLWLYFLSPVDRSGLLFRRSGSP